MPFATDARDRISIERMVEADNGDHAWSPWLTVWAAAEPEGDGRYRFRVRYRGDLRERGQIEPALRVLHAGDYYDVLDVTEAERHTETHLVAQRRIVEPIDDLYTGTRRLQAP